MKVLKTKLRNLSVENKEFVYWCQFEDSLYLNISPKQQKTIKICCVFKSEPPNEQACYSWQLCHVKAKKDEEVQIIHLAQPKFISAIIKYLLKSRPELFYDSNKEVYINDAWNILYELGYTGCVPLWNKVFSLQKKNELAK
jgi:hypothetical protein